MHRENFQNLKKKVKYKKEENNSHKFKKKGAKIHYENNCLGEDQKLDSYENLDVRKVSKTSFSKAWILVMCPKGCYLFFGKFMKIYSMV